MIVSVLLFQFPVSEKQKQYKITNEKNVQIPVPHQLVVPVKKNFPVTTQNPLNNVNVTIEKLIHATTKLIPLKRKYHIKMKIMEKIPIPVNVETFYHHHLSTSANGQHCLNCLPQETFHTGSSKYFNS